MERPNDSELKVMEVLWAEGDVPARRVAEVLEETAKWTKNTTYTLLTRVIAKGLVERIDPGYLCRALVTRKQVQRSEASKFVDKLFSGSISNLFAALVDDQDIPKEELDKLARMIDEMK